VFSIFCSELIDLTREAPNGFIGFPENIWFALQRWTRFRNFTVFHNQKNTEEIMKSAIWMSSLMVAAAGGWLAATMFAAPATSREPRFPQLTMDQLDEKQKPLGEQIMKVSSVGLGGPYNPMIRSPVLGQRLFDLFYYLRWETSVPTKLNEFAILIIGRQWRSQVEWYAHAPLAAKAGLSPEIIAELKAGKRPSSMAEDEALVYDFVTELTTTQKVSDETYARAKKVFNDQQIVDLTAVSGNYVMVAMLLAMSEETVPPGKEPPFKVGEK
jgi:4-carboxymuconolactone decarboxylase